MKRKEGGNIMSNVKGQTIRIDLSFFIRFRIQSYEQIVAYQCQKIDNGYDKSTQVLYIYHVLNGYIRM